MVYEEARFARALKILNLGNFKKSDNPYFYIFQNGDFISYIQQVEENKTFKETDVAYISQFQITETIKNGNETYYICAERQMDLEWNYIIYKVLPRVGSGELCLEFGEKEKYYFNWKQVKKYGTLEMVISKGLFDFVCVYNGNNSGFIDVKYTKCDNKHNTNVTIERITLKRPANLDYIYAIKDWCKEFNKELMKVA